MGAEPTRRMIAVGALALAATAAGAVEPARDITYLQDFDELWRTLDERYCFFGEKPVDWRRVRTRYRPMAAQAESDEAFKEVLRQVLAELYDAHTHLAQPPEHAPRWPPFDLLVTPEGPVARVVAVQAGSAAADSGITVGDRIVEVGGLAIGRVAADLGPRCLVRPDPAAYAYSLNVAVAGRRGQGRSLSVVKADGGRRTVNLALKQRPGEPDVSSRKLEGGLGYIRIASFGDDGAVARFDAALAELRDRRGLIIDVRGNGGGDTAVARPIMGRFITKPALYAMMRRREGRGLGAPWRESVEPRGPFTYSDPVVVLTDHWSASMAEGFPMGMRGLGRARIVGAPMMGLGAAVFHIRLDRTGLEAQYSAEPVYDVTGAPRWRMRPDVETEPGADILAAGVAELQRMTSRP